MVGPHTSIGDILRLRIGSGWESACETSFIHQSVCARAGVVVVHANAVRFAGANADAKTTVWTL